jgi:FkbM family methyltransferase
MLTITGVAYPLMTPAHAIVNKVLFGVHRFASPLQRGIQRLLSGPREVTFEFKRGPAAGYSFSCLSSHRHFFVREDYEHELLRPIESLIHHDSVVYDIGAHFGYWAIVLSRLCPQGKVFAFEPSPENRARLRKNVVMNSIQNIHIVPFAVSDRVGTSHLSSDGSMAKIGVGPENIETITLDEFCKNNPAPDMMLIDVEGHAGEVLRGASGVHLVPMICEIHSESELSAVRAGANSFNVVGSSLRFPYHAAFNADSE